MCVVHVHCSLVTSPLLGVRVGVYSHVYVLPSHVYVLPSHVYVFPSHSYVLKLFFFLAGRMQGVGVYEKQKNCRLIFNAA